MAIARSTRAGIFLIFLLFFFFYGFFTLEDECDDAEKGARDDHGRLGAAARRRFGEVSLRVSLRGPSV